MSEPPIDFYKYEKTLSHLLDRRGERLEALNYDSMRDHYGSEAMVSHEAAKRMSDILSPEQREVRYAELDFSSGSSRRSMDQRRSSQDVHAAGSARRSSVYSSSIYTNINENDVIADEIATTLQQQQQKVPRPSFDSYQHPPSSHETREKSRRASLSIEPSMPAKGSDGGFKVQNFSIAAGLSRVNLAEVYKSGPTSPTEHLGRPDLSPKGLNHVDAKDLFLTRSPLSPKPAASLSPVEAARAAAMKLASPTGGKAASTAAQLAKTRRGSAHFDDSYTQGDIMSRLARWGDGKKVAGPLSK